MAAATNMAGSPDLKTLKAVLFRYDVTICDAEDLFVLKDYDIAFIADDSGSMGTRTKEGCTRWEELKQTVGQIIDIATCFDTDGIDIYFLNRATITGVQKSKDERLVTAFALPPKGGTPLTETLEKVLAAYKAASPQKPLLLMIASDGVPNGGARKLANTIKTSIKSFEGNVRYQLLACSDNDADIGWMNTLDDEFQEVDCTDDYESEKRQVLRAGRVTKFERSDWMMKALLGPVSKKFDDWDEQGSRVTVGSPFARIVAVLIVAAAVAVTAVGCA